MKTDNDGIYRMDGTGRLFRRGEHIGDLDGEGVSLFPEMRRYAAAVTRWLREAEAAGAADGEDDGDGGDALVMGSGRMTEVVPVPAELLDEPGVDEEMREQMARARAVYLDDVDFARRTGCPPPPKKNPHSGDKTPAFVEWLHRFRHDEFVIRYGVTGKGRVPVVETDPLTGMEVVTGYRETYFARRKTHLTERDVSREGLSDDMDWDA